jgi:SOS-response transcriptional repressor LexA
MAAPTKAPTARQAVVLACIASLTHQKGYPPTQQEIAQAMGCRRGTVRGYLYALQRKGLLLYEEATARSIRVSQKWLDCERAGSNYNTPRQTTFGASPDR